MSPGICRRSFKAIALSSLLFFAVTSCDVDDNECSNDSDCDDGLFCSGEETCHRGTCNAPIPRDCDDNLVCTVDGCDEDTDQCVHEATDVDGDGHFDPLCGGDDCDDQDDSTFPGATEVCDGADNDCDGVVAEDQDSDQHYDATFCAEGDDCDDSCPTCYPGADEICDGLDNNCVNGTDDEADTDEDGSIDTTCDGDDCDDENPDISPLAPELCNGIDDDCDDLPDEDFDCIAGVDYLCDTSCHSEGTMTCTDDCQFPEICTPPAELCNGDDDDCDDLPDNGFECVFGQITECVLWCGELGSGICTDECLPPEDAACLAPPELCNGIDDNCNGGIDEGFDCPAGHDSICTTDCNTTGTGPCSDDCLPALTAQCTPPPEICNDLRDNDCDGDEDCVDEDCIGDIACGGG